MKTKTLLFPEAYQGEKFILYRLVELGPNIRDFDRGAEGHPWKFAGVDRSSPRHAKPVTRDNPVSR